MLLKFYKTNRPLILVFLPVISFIIWVPSFGEANAVEIVNTTPVFDFFVTNNHFINELTALSILVFTAFILNNTINKNEFFQQNIYLPSLISILLMSILPKMNMLHPILFSNFFLALSFLRLISIHSQVSCKSEIFDGSLLLLIGGLFYPPTLLYLPIIWIALVLFRPFKWKEWAIPFLALGLFLIYFLVSFLFTDKTSYYLLYNLLESSIYQNNSYSAFFYLFGFLSFLFFLLGMRRIHLKRKSSTMRYKKMTNLILALFILGLLNFGIIYLFTFTIESISLIYIPFTIAISYFLVYFKKTMVAELGLFMLILLVALNNYL